MKTTKDKVRELINSVPALADSDTRLCSHIWFHELKDMKIDPFESKSSDFLKMYAQGKLTQAPSIKRARAKLQEEEPKYRGEKYYLRKGKYQDQWRKDLGYENN